MFENEILSRDELKFEEEKNHKIRLAELYKDLSTAQAKLNSTIEKCEQHENLFFDFQNANESLNKYIETLKGPFQNRGKEIGDLKSRSGTAKKFNIFKQRVNQALWFSKFFGLEFTEMKVVDKNGKMYNITDKPKSTSSSFECLSDDEKEKVKSLLYILDSFGISDEAYHEIAIQNDGLIRSYLVKQCRQSINGMCQISKTPGESPGAQLNFMETLEQTLEKISSEQSDSPPIVLLKIAADGAKMSRMSNFLILSLAVLNKGEEVMSLHGQTTIAIVDAKENFVSIKESFAEIFQEINALLETKNDDGYVPYTSNLTNENYRLEFFLGGDMKFLLTVLGLNAANSKFSCIYCKIEKNDRFDMTKDEDFFWTGKMKKSIEEMKELSKKKKLILGHYNPPPYSTLTLIMLLLTSCI